MRIPLKQTAHYLTPGDFLTACGKRIPHSARVSGSSIVVQSFDKITCQACKRARNKDLFQDGDKK